MRVVVVVGLGGGGGGFVTSGLRWAMSGLLRVCDRPRGSARLSPCGSNKEHRQFFSSCHAGERGGLGGGLLLSWLRVFGVVSVM